MNTAAEVIAQLEAEGRSPYPYQIADWVGMLTENNPPRSPASWPTGRVVTADEVYAEIELWFAQYGPNCFAYEVGQSRMNSVGYVLQYGWARPWEQPSPVPPDPYELPFVGGRFLCSVTWRNQHATGQSGNGTAIPYRDLCGDFWFQSIDSKELTVKIVDGRSANGYWWIFFGSLTDQEFALSVVDTITGSTKTYFNPAGVMASAADLSAFHG